MFVILYLVHGPNMRTTAALIGTLCGILIMAGISLLSVQVTRLSGIGDEASGILSSLTSPIDFRGPPHLLDHHRRARRAERR
ncbi:YibE/F family protein, partial [Leucobacter soli]|uniref:YibE/F family protein n=1 Tax=Leucobacter soli TaxID=2812850 RepID=UPI003609BDD6